jgi:hypothetical protein
VSNPKMCFNCRETGHFIVNCPYLKTAPSTFTNFVNGPKQMTRPARATPARTQRLYGKAKVNHIYAEQAKDTPDVVLGEFLVHFFLAIVLFDFRASHSFISSYFVESHDVPMVAFKETSPNQIPWRPHPMPLGSNQHSN